MHFRPLESLHKMKAIGKTKQAYGLIGLVSLWALALHLTLVGSIWLLPLSLLLFYPVYDLLMRCALTKHQIHSQAFLKKQLELLNSKVQTGEPLHNALVPVYDLGISHYQTCPKLLAWHIRQKRKSMCMSQYDLGFESYFGLLGLFKDPELDKLLKLSVETGLDLSTIIEHYLSKLSKQQRYRMETLTKLTSKQQEFALMCIAPFGIHIVVGQMMPSYFGSVGTFSHLVLGLGLQFIYVSAIVMFLLSNWTLLRRTCGL